MEHTPDTPPHDQKPGLRGRQKARRRQEILRCAEHLFARDGVEAATVAAIAERAGVSPPTVFNYFGSKENILSALIFEGTAQERTRHLKRPRKTDCPFADVVGDLMCEITSNTMQIAGKRVWRYAEAANIRRPESEFAKQFAHSDAELLKLVTVLLGDYAIVLRSGAPADLPFIAQLVYDCWSALYFAYIKDDPMTIDAHFAALRQSAGALVSLLFDESFAAHSPLKTQEAAQ